METPNQLKEKALRILLDETFSCIEKHMYEAHVGIARENAKLRHMTANFFMYGGEIYPRFTANGTSVKGLRVSAPPLHFSLIEKLEKANNLKEEAGYTTVRNYFSAVLGASFYGMVLESLLPGVLVNRLKKDLSPEEYKTIDSGAYPMSKPILPVEDVKAFIAQIREHYQDTSVFLRRLLMNNFLLQE